MRNSFLIVLVMGTLCDVNVSGVCVGSFRMDIDTYEGDTIKEVWTFCGRDFQFPGTRVYLRFYICISREIRRGLTACLPGVLGP